MGKQHIHVSDILFVVGLTAVFKKAPVPLELWQIHCILTYPTTLLLFLNPPFSNYLGGADTLSHRLPQ